MSRCQVCESPANDDGSPYRCSYCGEPVCETHRLPENHDCTGGERTGARTSESDGPEPADLSESNLPGETPRRRRRRRDSGPDVDPDGSIATGENVGVSDGGTDRSLLERIRSLLSG